MSEKEKCVVCEGYSSDIYSAFLQSQPCPRCFTTYETILLLEEVERKKKALKAQKVSEELIAENDSLKRMNIWLLEKVKKMDANIWSIFSDFDELRERLDGWKKEVLTVSDRIKEMNK